MSKDDIIEQFNRCRSAQDGESFRRWFAENSIDIEQCDDDGMWEVTMSIAQYGYEFQRGDLTDAEYLTAVRTELGS